MVLFLGVDVASLISKSAVEGLPSLPPRLLYYDDFNTIETAPAYKQLSFKAKYKLLMYNLYMTLYSTYLGRLYFNLNFKFSLYLMRYFPYLAFFRFGIKASMVNIFTEDPTDDTKPKPNADYTKPRKVESWYKILLDILW